MTLRWKIAACGLWIALGAEAQAQDKVDFAKQIQPLLTARCGKCHGAEKASGKLRLHSADAIAATEKKTVLVAGKPQESELFKRISLPADDKKRMPKGGDPLSADEIALVKRWIDEGAALGAVAAVAAPAADKPADETEAAKPEPPKEEPLPEAPAASDEAIAALEKAGATVMPLFADSTLLDVSFARTASPSGDEALVALGGAAEQIAWLNLSGAQATATGWAALTPLKNLMQLHAEKSTIDDAALAHLAGLDRLEYLNLYGTKITDAGLEHLKGLKRLRRLYLWQCKVSYDAAKALEAAVPGLEVNLGWDHPQVAKERLTKELASAKESAAAAAAQATALQQQLEAAQQAKTQTESRLKELEEELKKLGSPGEAAAGDEAGQDKESVADAKPVEAKAAEENAAQQKAKEEKAAAEAEAKAAAEKAATEAKAAAEKAAAEAKAAAEQAAAQQAAAEKAAADAQAAADKAAAEAKAAQDKAAAEQAEAEKAAAEAKAAEEKAEKSQ